MFFSSLRKTSASQLRTGTPPMTEEIHIESDEEPAPAPADKIGEQSMEELTLSMFGLLGL